MAEFSVNPTRIDPYKNFKFRVKWDGNYVAGVSKVSALKVTSEPVLHRDGGDLSTQRKSPGLWKTEKVELTRGITYDTAFEEWATQIYSVNGDAAVSLKNFRKDITIDLFNLQGVKVKSWNLFRCWVAEYTAAPEFDANANAIAFESIGIEYEGFQRDLAVTEQAEF